MSTSRVTRTLTAVAAAAITAAAAVALSSPAGADHPLTNESSCDLVNGTLKTTDPAQKVAGGMRISYEVTCTGNRQFSEEVEGTVEGQGTVADTTVFYIHNYASSQGNNTVSRVLEVPNPPAIPRVCVKINGAEHCIPPKA